MKKNKNLCSGYFCSFIPLTCKNNNLNISIFKGQYKKQLINEFSKYNKNYMNTLGNKCSDIVNKYFKKHIGSNSRLPVTHKCGHLIYSGQNMGLGGTFKYNNIGIHSMNKPIKISGTKHSKSRKSKKSEARNSTPRENFQLKANSTGQIKCTTQGCKGSGPIS